MSRILLLIVAFALAVVVQATNNLIIKVGSNGGLTFDPQTASIMPGDTVIWQFDGGPHTVTQSDAAKSCKSISPAGFDSSQKMLGDSFALTFNKTGKIWYYCTVGAHCSGKGMYGTLLVGMAGDNTTTNSTDGSNSTATTGAASSGRGSTHVLAVTAAVLLSSMVVAGFLL